MEQFELRFIVCGSDLAATRECAKILFEAPLPGKVTLRQDRKFLFGTVTIGYAGTASPDWQAALTSDLLTEIQFRERVESVLSKLCKEGPGPAVLGRCRREGAVGAGEIAGAHHI